MMKIAFYQQQFEGKYTILYSVWQVWLFWVTVCLPGVMVGPDTKPVDIKVGNTGRYDPK